MCRNTRAFPKKRFDSCGTYTWTNNWDLTGKKNGHGAYISKSLETLALAKKNKALQRALETEIPDEVYQELEAIITNE